jgi:putative tricarboxylic transport membrane protein
MSGEQATATAPRGIAKGDLGVAVGIVVIGLIAAWQTTEIPQSAYASVGPRVFAWATSAMLIVMGLFLVRDAVNGGWSHETDDFGEVDWPGGLWLVGGLAVNATLIDFIGFILSSTFLVIFTAKAFGSDRLARDGMIGFVLALVSYVGFDRVLGYKIGSGLIEALI